MEFNDRLRAVLDAREWNQKRLAQELGSPASTVSQWINGQRTPDGEQLQRLGGLLAVDAEWLRSGDGPEPRELRRRARNIAHQSVEWISRRAPIDGGRDGGNANQFTIRPSIANLVREAIQNAVDEWLGEPHGPVRVRFR